MDKSTGSVYLYDPIVSISMKLLEQIASLNIEGKTSSPEEDIKNIQLHPVPSFCHVLEL
jgi:hypothetical protein